VAKPEYEDMLDLNVVDGIKDRLLKCWNRFDYDVYAAAYALQPYFFEDVRGLNVQTASSSSREVVEGNNDDLRESEYFRLREAVERVFMVMARRFPPRLGAAARETVLPATDADVRKDVSDAMDQFDEWRADARKHARKYTPGDSPGLPSGYWEVSALTKLRGFAARLVDACVGSTDIERLHAVLGMHRTKRRNRMGYVRSHALGFLDSYLSCTRDPPSLQWERGMQILAEFMMLSDEDETYFDSLDRRVHALREASAADAEAGGSDSESSTSGPELDEETATDEERAPRAAVSRFAAALAALAADGDGGGDDPLDEDFAPTSAATSSNSTGRGRGGGGRGRGRGRGRGGRGRGRGAAAAAQAATLSMELSPQI